MTGTNAQWESTGLERFGHLEDKIKHIVEAFRALRKESDTLRAENQKLKEEVSALQRTELAAQDNLDLLQKEREELRERVEKALGLLATLETR